LKNITKNHLFLPTCPCRPGLQAEGQGFAGQQLSEELGTTGATGQAGQVGQAGQAGQAGSSCSTPSQESWGAAGAVPGIGHLPGDRGTQDPLPTAQGWGHSGASPQAQGRGHAQLQAAAAKPQTWGCSLGCDSLFFLDLVKIILGQCQIINLPLNINYL